MVVTSSTDEIVLEASARPKLMGSLRELWSLQRRTLAFAEWDLRSKNENGVSRVA